MDDSVGYPWNSSRFFTDTSIVSCANYPNQQGKTAIITWDLKEIYFIDAILLMGQNDKLNHISEFYLYVGFFEDYKLNTPCPGGPYAYPDDGTYGTYECDKCYMGTQWVNGVEAWCNMNGRYVNFVRKDDAQMSLLGAGDLTICTFGVIADNSVKRYQKPVTSVGIA